MVACAAGGETARIARNRASKGAIHMRRNSLTIAVLASLATLIHAAAASAAIGDPSQWGAF
jgi:hypothetical protein